MYVWVFVEGGGRRKGRNGGKNKQKKKGRKKWKAMWKGTWKSSSLNWIYRFKCEYAFQAAVMSLSLHQKADGPCLHACPSFSWKGVGELAGTLQRSYFYSKTNTNHVVLRTPHLRACRENDLIFQRAWGKHPTQFDVFSLCPGNLVGCCSCFSKHSWPNTTLERGDKILYLPRENRPWSL